MPILLNCLEEPGTPANCCEQPYQFVTSDCVLKCLLAEALEVTRDVRTRYAGMLLSGTAGYAQAGQQVQDFQMLVRFLHDIFLEQVQTVNGGGTALTVQEQWDTYQLKCVADYFFCRYHYDIRPMLLHAGLYDPAYPPSIETLLKLPPYMEIPCGTPLPVPPPEPPADCVIPTWMEVADVVDSSFEVTADPSLAYLIKGNETNGTGGWHDHVGEVASSGGFNAPDLPYQVVSASDGAIWVVDGGGVHLLYPAVYASQSDAGLTLWFPTVAPDAQIEVEVETNAGWTSVYEGASTSLPALVSVDGTVTRVRTTWTDGLCVYEASVNLPVADCAPDYLVDYAGDANQFGLFFPSAGATFWVISDNDNSGNEFSAHIGEIGTGDGSAWTWIMPAAGSMIQAASNDITYQSELFMGTGDNLLLGPPPLYYPAMDMDWYLGGGTLHNSNSNFTDGHNTIVRDVLVEISPDGLVWTEIYNGPESAFYYGSPLFMIPIQPLSIRLTYQGDCPLVVEGTVNGFRRNSFANQVGRYLIPQSGSYENGTTVCPLSFGNWSFGAWYKRNIGVGDPLPSPFWPMQLVFLGDSSSIVFQISMVYYPAGSDPAIPSGGLCFLAYKNDGSFKRSFTTDDLLDKLIDGDWHSVVFVHTGGAADYEVSGWELWIDGLKRNLVDVDLSVVFPKAGASVDFTGVIWDNNIAEGSNGITLPGWFIANFFACGSALTGVDINGAVANGDFEPVAASIGLQWLWAPGANEGVFISSGGGVAAACGRYYPSNTPGQPNGNPTGLAEAAAGSLVSVRPPGVI